MGLFQIVLMPVRFIYGEFEWYSARAKNGSLDTEISTESSDYLDYPLVQIYILARNIPLSGQ